MNVSFQTLTRNNKLRAIWLIIRFLQSQEYFPSLLKPRTFSEKILYRQIFDRRNRLRQVANKISMRSVVEEAGLGAHLVPIICCEARFCDIEIDALPECFVIKASHGSGWVHVVKDKSKENFKLLKEKAEMWLSTDYCDISREWCYYRGKRALIVEPFLSCDGNVPKDYKFFCFSGALKIVQVDNDRFGDHHRNFYDRDWNALEVSFKHPRTPDVEPRPENFLEMVSIAEKLSAPWDFLRVDLFNIKGKIYIGELTVYPGAGREQILPRSFDYTLGENWRFPSTL